MAMPPLPFSPVKFSGEMERDSAFESLARFPRFVFRPSNVGFCANAAIVKNPQMMIDVIFFILLRF